MNNIQELKFQVGQEAESVIARELGLEKVNTNYRCPNASAHNNGDRKPSLGWHRGAQQFYCFTCGYKMDIYGLHKQQGLSHTEIMQLYEASLTGSVRKKEFQLEPLTDECKLYLHNRLVDDETMGEFGVQSYQGRIAFPYYEAGSVVGVKHRSLGPPPEGDVKYLAIPGSKLSLFNKQAFPTDELIICEGEIDAMVIHQCGYTNVVSVGTGANALEQLFVEQKPYFDQYDALIVVSDNDEAGKNMDRKFVEQFGHKAKLVNKALYEYKDVNEEYYHYGEVRVKSLIESAIVKIEGLRDLDKEPYRGVTAIRGNYIATGINTIDEALNDLAPQCVTLVTGRSNGGKSTFINQIIAHAIDNDNKVFLVNGEGSQEIIINRFYQAVIGRDEENYEFIRVNKRFFKEPKPRVRQALRYWHWGKFKLFNKGDSELKSMDALFELMSTELKTEGHNLVVIDNLMSVLSVERAEEKLQAQADFMQRCSDLAKNQSAHIILALHPNKTLEKGGKMDFEQISGTLDLANKADNIMVVRREYDEDERAKGLDGDISVLKNRYFPDLPIVPIRYEETTGLLLESYNGRASGYSFRWDRFLEGVSA